MLCVHVFVAWATTILRVWWAVVHVSTAAKLQAHLEHGKGGQGHEGVAVAGLDDVWLFVLRMLKNVF